MVRVRIAVVVDGDGGWSASGWSNADDGEAENEAVKWLDDFNYRTSYVVADVALPDVAEVEGRVDDE